jgi:hypothetical protein
VGGINHPRERLDGDAFPTPSENQAEEGVYEADISPPFRNNCTIRPVLIRVAAWRSKSAFGSLYG